jgi:protocatechuate 3,4-dioxygenase beta subunit
MNLHETSEVERTNLDAHVSICAVRYAALETRLAAVDQRLYNIDTLLSDIRDNLAQQPAQRQQDWTQAKTAVIGVLVSLVAFLAYQVLF